jgi:tetratricopeptide (TPR) repeat protein
MLEEKILNSPSSSESAISQVNLGQIRLHQRDLESALNYFDSALQVLSTVDMNDNNLKIKALVGKAQVLTDLAQYDEAEQCYLDALMSRLTLDKRDTQEINDIVLNIVNLYETCQRFEDSEYIMEMSSQIDEALKSNTQEDSQYLVLEVMNHAAIAQSSQSQNCDRAESLFRYLITFMTQNLPEENLILSKFLGNYGELLRTRRRFLEASEILTSALKIRRQLVKEEKIDVLFLAESANNLGLAYRSLGKFDQAEALLTEALRIRKQRLDGKGTLLAGSLNNLAELYRDRGNYAQAVLYHETAVGLYERELSPDHPVTVNAKGNLGITLLHQSRVHTGEDLIRSAMNFFVKNEFSWDHPWMVKFHAEVEHIRAKALSDKGALELSIKIYDELIEQNTQPYVSEGFLVLVRELFVVRFKYAQFLFERASYHAAKDAYVDCLSFVVEAMDPYDPLLIQARIAQAENLRVKGDFMEALSYFEAVMTQCATNECWNLEQSKGRVLLGLAQCAHDSQNYDQAEILYEKVQWDRCDQNMFEMILIDLMISLSLSLSLLW